MASVNKVILVGNLWHNMIRTSKHPRWNYEKTGAYSMQSMRGY